MWNKISGNVSNIAHGRYYKTCIMIGGVPENIQVMKFENGLWWSDDANYTYYSPTHFWG